MAQSRSMVPVYDERELICLEALAEAAGMHPELVGRFVEYGLLEPAETVGSLVLFEISAAGRLRSIQRLRNDLGVNLPGIGIILELQERIRQLQREIEWLRRH